MQGLAVKFRFKIRIGIAQIYIATTPIPTTNYLMKSSKI